MFLYCKLFNKIEEIADEYDLFMSGCNRGAYFTIRAKTQVARINAYRGRLVFYIIFKLVYLLVEDSAVDEKCLYYI